MFLFFPSFLLVVASLVLQVASRTLYITPDDHHSTYSSDTITLSHCVSDSEMCFTSDTQLVFLWKVYNLKKDFIIQNVKNITIRGLQSTIKCTDSPVGVAIINVTRISLYRIKIIGCTNNYMDKLDNYSIPSHIDAAQLLRNASVHIHYCMLVMILDVSIIVDLGTDGMHVNNAMGAAALENILVTVTPSQSDNSTSNGLVVLYYLQTIRNSLYIQNFTYKQLSCNNQGIQNVFYIKLQCNKFKIRINIIQMIFERLCNIRVLYYCSVQNTNAIEVNIIDWQVQNISARHVKGFSMLLIFHNSDKNDLLRITNCMFLRNTNISSMIDIVNPHTAKTLSVLIKNCMFYQNHVANIIKDHTAEIAGLWYHPITLNIYDTTISSNVHSDGKSLISLYSGEIFCSNCIIVNNSYYESIIKLHLSSFVITDCLDVSQNHARYLLFSTRFSYTLLFGKGIFKASKNIIYWPLGKEIAYGSQNNPLCYFQFLEYSDAVHESMRISIVENAYTAPSHLIVNNFGIHFTGCKWIYSNYNGHELANPNDIFATSININNNPIGQENIGVIYSFKYLQVYKFFQL